jgi:prepilin-type N-terminal cleavage/methylation domain-containing protein
MAPHTIQHRGLTLLELVVVLSILAILAAMLVPMLISSIDTSQRQVTMSSMRNLHELIVNRYMLDMRGQVVGSVPIAKGLPGSISTTYPQLKHLFVSPTTSAFDPNTGRGWRGPYLLSGSGKYPGLNVETATARGFNSDFGVAGDDAPLDGWGNPVIIATSAHTSYLNVINPFADSTILGYLVSAGPDQDLHTPDDNLTLPLR